MTAGRLAWRERLTTDRAFGIDFALRGRTVDVVTSTPSEVVATHVEIPRVETCIDPVESAAAPFVISSEPRSLQLDRLRDEHAAHCPHCTRATAHTRLVFGEGDPDARLVFVGEAPGETEDELGRPFVGKAGKKLDEMIGAMGLRREDVYIANILKARPPGNRTPLPDEVAACGPTLTRQLAIIRPRAIVTLGSPATKYLLDTETGISRLRGIWSRWAVPEPLGGGEIPVMPTFHPAYLLRNYTPETRQAVWSDLQQVMTLLGAGGR